MLMLHRPVVQKRRSTGNVPDFVRPSGSIEHVGTCMTQLILRVIRSSLKANTAMRFDLSVERPLRFVTNSKRSIQSVT